MEALGHRSACILGSLAMAVLSCTSDPINLRAAPSATPPPTLSAYENELRTAISELERISGDLEAFGTISASSGALIRDPKKRFGFELGLTPKELFERNRLEGASALRDLMAYSARGAVRILPAPEAAAAAALPLPDAGSGETPAPAEPVAPDAGEAPEPADAEAAEPTEAPEPTLVPVPALPAGAPASGTLPTPSFTPGLAIGSPDALSMSVRDLIKLSSDDYLTQKLIEFMSGPEIPASNKIVLAAVLSVSVRPGWRTYTGYTGEIDLRAGYWCTPDEGKPPYTAELEAFDRAHPNRNELSEEATAELAEIAEEARKTGRKREECIVTSDEEEVSPLAFAAFPAFDAQVLDERSSFRRQLALALAIEAQGPEVAGALEQELVRRLEHDLATRSTVNTIVGYNESGVHFGWRFSPKAFAHVDPTDPDGGPGLLLQPQSFPALVFLIADKSDLPRQYGGICPDTYEEADQLPAKLKAKRAERDRETDAKKKAKLAEEVKNLDLAFVSCPELIHDSILFDYTTRWYRAPDPGADQSWIPFRGWWNRLWRPELRESRYLDWAAAVTNAESTLVWSKDQRTAEPPLLEKDRTPHLEFQLEKKLAQIRAASVKVDVVQEIPKAPPDPVAIGAVAPRAVVSAKTGDSWFVVTGKGFLGGTKEGQDPPPCPTAEGKVPVVNVSGAKGTLEGCTDEVLVVKIANSAVQQITGKADVAVVATTGKTAILKDALTAVASAGPPAAAVDIGWVVGSDGSAHVSSISTRGSGTSALDVVKALSQPPPKPKAIDLDLELKASEKSAP
jgi:hypothetical protein